MNRRTRVSAIVTALAAAGLAGGTVLAGSAAGSSEQAGAQVAQLRKTIAPYQDVARALADGFQATPDCVASPDGGMGYHYVNWARLRGPIDPSAPPILLYRDGKKGLELTGAEFFQPDADQDLSTDADRPSLWGQPFNGPMPGHEPGMPMHYDLHVWTNVANPDGVFQPWNRKITC